MNINQSPFNVGLPIELPEFTADQVQDLAGRHGLSWNTSQIGRLMGMVGGHPYLVRLALYHIHRGDTTLEGLLREAATEAGLYGDHLRRHLWNLEQHPELGWRCGSWWRRMGRCGCRRCRGFSCTVWG